MSPTSTLYKPQSAQRFSYVSNGCTLYSEQTTEYTYMRWIPYQFHTLHDFNAVFIHLRKSPYVYLKWSELKIALFHEAMWIVAEAYTPAPTIMLMWSSVCQCHNLIFWWNTARSGYIFNTFRQTNLLLFVVSSSYFDNVLWL